MSAKLCGSACVRVSVRVYVCLCSCILLIKIHFVIIHEIEHTGQIFSFMCIIFLFDQCRFSSTFFSRSFPLRIGLLSVYLSVCMFQCHLWKSLMIPSFFSSNVQKLEWRFVEKTPTKTTTTTTTATTSKTGCGGGGDGDNACK